MRILLCLGILAVSVPLAEAQERPRARTIPVQFQFAPPGARAVGMGSTFIAIADDATASESNPAGLTILSKPEISAHMRVSRFENEFVDPFQGDPNRRATFSDRVVSPAYFSFVYPFKSAAFSVYYQQATNFRLSSSFTDTDEIFAGSPANLSLVTSTDLLLDTVGASLAIKLTPKVSLGGSVRGSRLKFADTGNVFDYKDVDGDNYQLSRLINDNERKVTFNAGILLNPNGKVSVGAFYKNGGKFDLVRVEREVSSGPNFRNLLSSGPTPENVRYEIPDYYGGGIAVRPTDRWLISAEVVRINYSVLSPAREDLDDNPETLLPIDDGTEFHLGTEYTFLSGKTPFSVRAGIFTDPDHDGLRNVDSDQIHGTFGAGFVLGGHFQVDFASNIAKRVKEALVSFVYRF